MLPPFLKTESLQQSSSMEAGWMELCWVWLIAKGQAQMTHTAGGQKAGKATILERNDFMKYQLWTGNTSFQKSFFQAFIHPTLFTHFSVQCPMLGPRDTSVPSACESHRWTVRGFITLPATYLWIGNKQGVPGHGVGWTVDKKPKQNSGSGRIVYLHSKH